MLNFGMNHHFSKVNTQGEWDCGHVSKRSPGFALWLSATRNEHPSSHSPCDQVTVVLEERTGWIGLWWEGHMQPISPVSSWTCWHSLAGVSFSAVMTPGAPSLPGGCPNQTWAPSTTRELWGRRASRAVWVCGSLLTRAGRSAGRPCPLTAPCRACILPAEKNHQHKRQGLGAT